MSGPSSSLVAFEQAVAGLRAAAELNAADVDRLRSLRDRVETITAGALVEPPHRPDRVRLITAGWAYEARLLPNGRRQIFGYLLPGDLISSRHGTRSTPSILFALTRLETVDLPPTLLRTPTGEPTSLGSGVARALQRQEHRAYDALVRLGQYTAQERVANLLIELRDRLMRVGEGSRESFRGPLTQEYLADTLGLSVIHVNRVLRQLRTENLLRMKFGVVTLIQPERLERLAAGAAGRSTLTPPEAGAGAANHPPRPAAPRPHRGPP